MLKRLRIKNFALIDELEVEFGRGLNVLTGSTGAGKSIIISAIELAAGKRGSDEIVRTGKSKAVVEAEFELNADDTYNNPEIRELTESGNSILMKREYRRIGGGYAYIGNNRVNLPTLKTISEHLLSIMGQHSHQKLLDPSTHIGFLDNCADIHQDLAVLRKLYAEVVDLRQKLSHARRNIMEVNDRIELLRFQISELERADLKENEEEKLKGEQKLLENARSITEAGENAISMLLESDDSVVVRVGETEKLIRSSASGQKELEDILGMISAASDSINQAAIKIRNFIDGMENNPERLEEINTRLYEIFRLKKQYGKDIPGILEYLEKSKKELVELGFEAEDPEKIRERLDERLIELSSRALKISGARNAAKTRLEKTVMENLSRMGMQKAQFFIDISRKKDESGVYTIDGEKTSGDASGFDIVEFLFCANPGEGLKPLTKIASGGEISRVMLALKNALTDKTGGGCEIFDEIDVGISGEAASRVAEQLKNLSGNRQVICITHLHQIASAADYHFKVSKKKVKGRSITTIQEIKSEDRVREIASLLSGKTITEKAMEGAREILKNSKR